MIIHAPKRRRFNGATRRQLLLATGRLIHEQCRWALPADDTAAQREALRVARSFAGLPATPHTHETLRERVYEWAVGIEHRWRVWPDRALILACMAPYLADEALHA